MTTKDDLHRLIWLLTQLDEVKAQPPADQDLSRALSEPIRALRAVIDEAINRLKRERGVCPTCNGLGTVPNTDDSSLNVRMRCPEGCPSSRLTP